MDIGRNITTLTIPITVDSVKDIKSFQMTRCTYFSIECSEPASGWMLHVDNVDVHFFMIGLSGIVTSPPGDELFDTPEKLDHLFETIEHNSLLYVDINDIWLPTELFFRADVEPKRGRVFRIGFDLFSAAYRQGAEERSDKDILGRMKQMNIPETLSFSEPETDALLSWNDMQIEMIRENYHGNRRKQLPRKSINAEPPAAEI